MGMTWRRRLFAALVAATGAGVVALMAMTLSVGGFGGLDLAMLVLFAMTVPWYAIGFWNAALGLALLRLARDPIGAVAPFARRAHADAPIAMRTAIVICIRNEDPSRAFRNLAQLMEGLAAAGWRDRFHAFVLSDTDQPEIAAAEEGEAAALAARCPATYRRRTSNEGFKAGNIREFCLHWGRAYDFMVTLDADSIMAPEAVLRLARMMEANPRLGIVQTLVGGMPSTSAFARIFQFGMRLGMRSYTLGTAAWQGDCGPYWGHNAILRLTPFIAHCHIPKLPGRPPLGGDVLSHDQLEAALMRRAGYEVRVIPEEGGSWEANPPTLIEFIRRDLRWCQGNMQYGSFIAMPGILPVSRYHLALAMMMYFGAPAWVLFMGLVALRLAIGDTPVFDPVTGPVLLAVVLAMVFAPKIASAVDVLLRAEQRRAFGGGWRFVAGFVLEFVFSCLLFPITTLAHTVFLLGLPFSRTLGWSGQQRDDHAVPFLFALRKVWLQTVLGVVGTGLFLAASWEAWAYGQLGLAGLLLAAPLAVATASPWFGQVLVRYGICRLPEETDPPEALVRAGLPALALRTPPSRAPLPAGAGSAGN
ncbi:MAG: glucans biosynthesis glucosyltransferase MdoH [Alphaproteobacteria bacterium]|nr:glucans biosynthesis glucosyltransferase MdoH [Alphaproteobacteria bacterium]